MSVEKHPIGQELTVTIEKYDGRVIHFMATQVATDKVNGYDLSWVLGATGTNLALSVNRDGQVVGQYSVNLIEIMNAMGAAALADLATTPEVVEP